MSSLTVWGSLYAIVQCLMTFIRAETAEINPARWDAASIWSLEVTRRLHIWTQWCHWQHLRQFCPHYGYLMSSIAYQNNKGPLALFRKHEAVFPIRQLSGLIRGRSRISNEGRGKGTCSGATTEMVAMIFNYTVPDLCNTRHKQWYDHAVNSQNKPIAFK